MLVCEWWCVNGDMIMTLLSNVVSFYAICFRQSKVHMKERTVARNLRTVQKATLTFKLSIWNYCLI